MIKMPSMGTTVKSGAGTMLELGLASESSVSSVQATLPGGSGDVLINSPWVEKTRHYRVSLLLLLVVVKLGK